MKISFWSSSRVKINHVRLLVIIVFLFYLLLFDFVIYFFKSRRNQHPWSGPSKATIPTEVVNTLFNSAKRVNKTHMYSQEKTAEYCLTGHDSTEISLFFNSSCPCGSKRGLKLKFRVLDYLFTYKNTYLVSDLLRSHWQRMKGMIWEIYSSTLVFHQQQSHFEISSLFWVSDSSKGRQR